MVGYYGWADVDNATQLFAARLLRGKNVLSIINAVRRAVFRNKIERLENAFSAASEPFHSEVRGLEKEEAEFQAQVDDGKAAWIEERDDDGYAYDHGEVLAERRQDAIDTLQTLRKAFITLIYHQWERSAQQWVNAGKRPNHDDLVKALKAAHLSLDEAGLKTLRLLVNTLKHNSENYGEDLHRSRPDLFDTSFNPQSNNPITGRPFSLVNWADHLVLVDDNIDEFFMVVKKSSPS